MGTKRGRGRMEFIRLILKWVARVRAIHGLSCPLTGATITEHARGRDQSEGGITTKTAMLRTLGGTLFFLPLNLIQVQRYSPTAAGAALLPLILIIFLLSRWSGALVQRCGAKLPLVIGPLIAAAGFALFARPAVGGAYWTTFFPALVLLGIGMAVSVAPLTTTVMSSVAGDRAGVASGINNAVSRTAGLLSIAVLGIVMLHIFDRSLGGRLAKLEASPSVKQSLYAQRSRLAGIELPEAISPETRALLTDANDGSFVDGFRYVMLIGAALALGSAVTALLLIHPHPSSVPAANGS